MTLKLHGKTHESHMELHYEFELCNLWNRKLGQRRIMVKATKQLDLLLSAIFSIIVYCIGTKFVNRTYGKTVKGLI